MDTWAAIGLMAQLVFCPDLYEQRLIRLHSLAFRTTAPGIVSTVAHSQHPAHAFHIMLAFMRYHKLIPHLPLREKMFTAFFRISRSSSTSASFCCNRRISAFAASRSLG